jgi:soluble lytic murein transglycosylase
VGSTAGALGLMQIIPDTGAAIAAERGVTGFETSDLFRPEVAIPFGAHYLAGQLDAFDGNLYHVFAAYNGGPGAALDAQELAGDNIDLFVEELEFEETNLYVRRVMEHYARYRQTYGNLDRPSLPQ